MSLFCCGPSRKLGFSEAVTSSKCNQFWCLPPPPSLSSHLPLMRSTLPCANSVNQITFGQTAEKTNWSELIRDFFPVNGFVQFGRLTARRREFGVNVCVFSLVWSTRWIMDTTANRPWWWGWETLGLHFKKKQKNFIAGGSLYNPSLGPAL